jgi:hypothetical protein
MARQFTTTETLTDEQIETLRDEAGAAGDLEMVETCERALAGSDLARADVADAIAAAEAMAD